MTRFNGFATAFAMFSLAIAAPVLADTPRELLTVAVFDSRDVPTALVRVDRAQAAATAILQRDPGNEEAAVVQATAFGYHAKLTGSRTEVAAARKRFEALVARYPRDAEAQVALGAWHLGVVNKVGAFFGRAAVGAQKSVGFAATDRAVALGGNRALILGLAALLRLQLDPNDARGAALAAAGARGATPTPGDRIMQRACVAVVAALRQNDDKATKRLAARLLPLGQLDLD